MIELHLGDCLDVLKRLKDKSVSCCVTSPPYYGQRDYGVDGQLGLEKTPEEYVQKLVYIFREVKKRLRPDGNLWLNLGDSYTGGGRGASDAKFIGQGTREAQKLGRRDKIDGLPAKNLIGIPWRVAFALQSDGWFLRQDIIWKKNNPMPESVRDRCTKSHEYIFLLTKASRYYFDHDAIKEPSKYPNGPNSAKSIKSPYGQGFTRNAKISSNRKELRTNTESRHRSSVKGGQSLEKNPSGLRSKRSVWESEDHNLLIQWLAENKPEILKQYLDTIPNVWDISTVPFKGAHFATFPPKLAENCILAGCPKEGIVLDPFMGSGTTGMVSKMNGRNFVGIELNPEYLKMAEKRIEKANYQMSF